MADPVPPPLADWWPTVVEVLKVAGGMVVGAAAWALTLRRRFSSDSAEIAKDQTDKAAAEAERDLLKLLMAERARAVAAEQEAWKQRAVDAASNARLKAQLEAAQARIKELSDMVFGLRMHMQKQDAVIMKVAPTESGLMGLGEDIGGEKRR